MKTLNFPLLALLIILLITSCDKNEPPKCATYQKDVKAILDKTCAYSGCHSGADAGMFVTANSKDYTNYDGLLASLSSGEFKTRAIDSMSMPPPIFTPADKPKSLTADEIDILNCWIEAGYPES